MAVSFQAWIVYMYQHPDWGGVLISALFSREREREMGEEGGSTDTIVSEFRWVSFTVRFSIRM